MSHITNSFRINSLKVSPLAFESISTIERKQVPWYSYAYTCSKKIELGRTFEFFLGYVHPQSLGSMVPPLALDPNPAHKVLDLTASPGSKTSQLSMMMKNKGILVANDVREREAGLIGTLTRLGVFNVVVSTKDARTWPIKHEFDRVLLDAPCSALGSTLKSWKRFSLEYSHKLSTIQSTMIIRAFDALKDDGTLVYSTCTFSPFENEVVVANLLKARDHAQIEKIPLEIPHDEGLKEFGEGLEKTWRIYPHHLNSEGFFVAKIRKVEP